MVALGRARATCAVRAAGSRSDGGDDCIGERVSCGGYMDGLMLLRRPPSR